MRATSRLLESVRVTLFTRDHCGLCAKAKRELAQAWAQRPFDFNAVNIMRPEAKGWRDNYEFDIPVIHISKSVDPPEDPNKSSQAVKLMHSFTHEDVLAKIDDVERK